ncbi:Clp protease ClpP [Reichenbachiella sp.]|uniref:Clp protease ClpP n=1 Tax=Reichenbachiella sp. TaxID=2184521 RepID=UPI003B5CB61E
MSKWFENIVAKAGKPVEWRLIGNIGQWKDINAKDFNAQLSVLESKHSDIDMILHSGGGGIYEGLQLYNRAKRSKATINTDIEGLAASMGSALAMVGKHRRMARNARMMMHQGNGKVEGSGNKMIEVGKDLNALNETLAEIYAEAIQWKHPDRDAKWVMDNWLAEGKNTWFSGQEAFDAGLVHEVYDSNIKAAPATASIEEMVAFYDNSLTDIIDDPAAGLDDGSPHSNQNKNPMKKEQFILMLAKHGITFSDSATADGSEETFIGELSAKIKELKASADTAIKLQARIAELEGDALTEEITAAVKDGRISESQRGHYEKLASMTSNEEVIASIKEIPVPEAHIEVTPRQKKKDADGSLSKERENWNYQAWQENDPEGLIALADEDEAKFNALIEAYDPEQESNAKK